MIETDAEEGDPQWMAWLADRVCPKCGGAIKEVVLSPCKCATTYPCGHKVLHGVNAVERVRALWASGG